MKRRTLLASTGSLFSLSLGGCTGLGDDNDTSSENETTPTDGEQDEDEYPREPTPGSGRHLLSSFWVSESPEDIEPYSSTEPPVSDHEVVLDLFDEAIEQDEADESDYDRLGDEYGPRGESVTWEVSEEMYREISLDFEDIDTDENGLIFFSHNETLVALFMDIED